MMPGIDSNAKNNDEDMAKSEQEFMQMEAIITVHDESGDGRILRLLNAEPQNEGSRPGSGHDLFPRYQPAGKAV